MMLPITNEEREIMNKMHKLDEDSDEYKSLQKRLIELDEKKIGEDCPFVH